MNTRVLRYFIMVAEEGSLSKAALRLGVAQPALSQHIRKLEADLGSKLVHRTARGISLTEGGHQLLRHAQDIVARISAAQEDVRGLSETPVGNVAFGMSQSVAKVLALPLFKETQLTLPRVTLRFNEVNTGYIPELLRRRQIDMGVVFKPLQDTSFEHTVVVTEELHLVAPASRTRKKGKNEISFAEAAALPLFLPGRPHSLRELINDYSRRCRVNLNVKAEVDGIPQLRDFVAAGLGHTMLAPASVRDEVLGGLLSMRRIVNPIIRRQVIVCHARDAPLPRAAAAVRSLAVTIAHRLVREGAWPGQIPTSKP